ncbi:MAG TPA: RNA methyltransferase [Solirubrobacteraceae bacterium]|jgi:TrmH family RNA methyltransferase|nr:RNA methyltransferase [Solirubrobacteraceae bacterium]
MITSHHNPALQDVRRLLARRRQDGPARFVAEGEDLLAAADAAGWAPEVRLRAGQDVTAQALAKVSALMSGTRELAVYAERWADEPRDLCVALWGVRDPGNVGTVLRGALAFGAGSVAIGPGTADPYGPKAVRASMGAIFSVPLVRVADVAALPRPRLALVARAGVALREAVAPGTIVVGAERAGLPGEVVEGCDAVAHIPIASESLNAAMAATVALYEVRR